MAHEEVTLVKRTIWTATCPHMKEIRTEKAKERFCEQCGAWIPFVEESYTGPSLKK